MSDAEASILDPRSSTFNSRALSPDPVPAGKLGMQLFLASEAMFFVGLIGSFLVLQAGQRELFHHMASMLSTWKTTVLAFLLVIASAMLLQNAARLNRQCIAIGSAIAFLVLQTLICRHLLQMHTIVARVNDKVMIYNGNKVGTDPITLTGIRNDLPAGFDATKVTPKDLQVIAFRVNANSVSLRASQNGTFEIPTDAVLQDVTYGPSRNNFFGCYFLFVGTHLLHLLAGVLALLWLAVRTARTSVTDTNISSVQAYWHFVNVVGVLGLLLLYFA